MGVTQQVAQDLGLSDGQVIQATVEVRDNKVALFIKGFLIDAPTFKTEAPTFKTDAPTFNTKTPILKTDAPTFKTDAPTFKTNAPTFKTDAPTFKTDAPTFKTDAPTFKTNAPIFKLEAPNWNPVDAKNGEKVNLKANLTTAGWILTPSPALAKENSNVTNLGAKQTEPSLSANSSSNFGNPLNKNMSPLGSLPSWSPKLNSLLFEPSELNAVFELMMPHAISSVLTQPKVQDWLERWNKNLLSMASLNPSALKNAVLSQSRSVESQIAATTQVKFFGNLGTGASGGPVVASPQLVVGQDTKSMLASLSDLLSQMQPTPETEKLTDQLKAATHELEVAQVHTAQHLLRGEIAFHAVIPFWDADPVDLYFRVFRDGGEGKKNQEDKKQPSFTVDIHSKSRVLGEIWLNTSIKQSTQIDLIMWAVKPEVVELAKTNASELGYELSVSGLTLNSFQIFNAPRPAEQEYQKPDAGSVLDTLV
jgi:hypothetical protein